MMDIVACTDSGFVMPTGVMMYSVCVNNSESEINFHLVTNNLTANDKQKLQETVQAFNGKSIIFYDITKIDISDIPAMEKNSRLSITTYYRLYLTEILPQTIKKVIYLDGDIIVRHSLMPIWNINLDNYAVAAITEAHIDKFSLIDNLKYPREKGYFNAGVLVINLDYWRRKNLLAVFKDYMRANAEHIKYHDQDVLNYTLRDIKKMLPVKYNFQTGFLWLGKNYDSPRINQEIKEAIADCDILHFTGANPWQTSCRHPYRSTFFRYQSQTIWKDTPLQENRPIKVRIIKFFSGFLRKLKLIPELPPYGKGFLQNLKQLD